METSPDDNTCSVPKTGPPLDFSVTIKSIDSFFVVLIFSK